MQQKSTHWQKNKKSVQLFIEFQTFALNFCPLISRIIELKFGEKFELFFQTNDVALVAPESKILSLHCQIVTTTILVCRG